MDGARGDGGVFAVLPLGAAPQAGPVVVVSGVETGGGAAPYETKEEDEEGDGECASSQDSRDCCVTAGGGWWKGFCFERLESDRCYLTPIEVPDDPKLCTLEGFSVAEAPEGGRLYEVSFTPSSLAAPGATEAVTAQAGPDGAVVFEVPASLQPGGSLALRYTDLYGDVLVDVPSVPGVEVVEPSAGGGARITAATPRASAGQAICVCGTFPGSTAWNGLLLDGAPLGAADSASSRMAWVKLPSSVVPGEHVVSGAAAPGFPEADRAAVQVVTIGGAVDTTKLQQLQSTPIRLWIEGTEEPVTIRVRNKTPSIISIEGGDDQAIRTSGGTPNQLERTVRGLTPGAFDVEYELEGEVCPCASETTYYY